MIDALGVLIYYCSYQNNIIWTGDFNDNLNSIPVKNKRSNPIKHKNYFCIDGFKVTKTFGYDVYEKTNINNKREKAPKLYPDIWLYV